MNTIIELINNQDINANTKKIIINSFKRIIRDVFNDQVPDDLLQVDKVMEYINSDNVTPTTKKTLLYGYIHVLKYKDLNASDFQAEFNKISKVVDEDRKYADANETELNNHVTMKDLVKIRDDLKLKITDKFTKYDIYHLVMSLYTYIPPLRSQCYYSSKIFDDCKLIENRNELNYVCLTKKQLILNKHKTVATHGHTVIDIPDELMNIIISFKNKSNSKYLVCNTKLKPFEEQHFTRLLNTIIGKKVSSSMIRKIYLSEKNDGQFTGIERKKTANIMQHTVSTQQLFYTKFSKKLHGPDQVEQPMNESIEEVLKKHNIDNADLLKDLLALMGK